MSIQDVKYKVPIAVGKYLDIISERSSRSYRCLFKTPRFFFSPDAFQTHKSQARQMSQQVIKQENEKEYSSHMQGVCTQIQGGRKVELI